MEWYWWVIGVCLILIMYFLWWATSNYGMAAVMRMYVERGKEQDRAAINAQKTFLGQFTILAAKKPDLCYAAVKQAADVENAIAYLANSLIESDVAPTHGTPKYIMLYNTRGVANMRAQMLHILASEILNRDKKTICAWCKAVTEEINVMDGEPLCRTCTDKWVNG